MTESNARQIYVPEMTYLMILSLMYSSLMYRDEFIY